MEESFNIQAIYDLLYKSWSSVATFDHVDFPGVVPRTFIGPLIVSIIAYCPVTLLNLSPHAALHIVRGILATFVAISLISIRTSIARVFSPLAAFFFTLFTVIQFHIPFYASRPLSNVFAMVLSNFALADLLQGSPPKRAYRGVALLSVAVALFRSELVLLLFPTVLALFLSWSAGLLRLCGISFLSAMLTAIVSIAIDSYFWQQLSYPELEVFYFNAIRGGSVAWGVSPSHWYFTHALPRALGGALPLAFIGAVRFRARLAHIVPPALFFVIIYSALPHKELRFIFYVIPALNIAAAAIAADAMRNLLNAISVIRPKKEATQDAKALAIRYGILCFLILAFTIISFVGSLSQTAVSTWASRNNYPSAHALRRLHEKEEAIYRSSSLCEGAKRNALVHIDIDSAMNGISQFVYQRNEATACPVWTYSKDEFVKEDDWSHFTHLISQRRDVDGFCIIDMQPIFSRLDWRAMRLVLSNHTFVYRNRNVSLNGCLPPQDVTLAFNY